MSSSLPNVGLRAKFHGCNGDAFRTQHVKLEILISRGKNELIKKKYIYKNHGELEIAAPANAQRNLRRIAACAGNQPDCFHLSSGTVMLELMSDVLTVL